MKGAKRFGPERPKIINFQCLKAISETTWEFAQSEHKATRWFDRDAARKLDRDKVRERLGLAEPS